MVEIDLTKFRQAVKRNIQYIDNCAVANVGSGAMPRQIVVTIPGDDGAELIAINNSLPSLTTSDTVLISIDGNNQAARVEGYGVDTSPPTANLGEFQAFIVKNTSGATANANEVGYIDSAGEYKTTTTAENIVNWVVVIQGGANNADIYVSETGRVTIAYTGTAPSAGDYLTTSTTAGDAQGSADMQPAVFAVATAAGSGGTVEALLLTDTKPQRVTPSADIYGNTAGVNDSDFSGTIATLPGGAVLTYTPTGGDEVNLVPSSTSLLAKMVLHNTTRGDSALISNTVVGTNTITLTDTVPAGWATTDVITIRSTTNTATVAGVAYFIDFEITSTDIPALTRAINATPSVIDSGAANQLIMFHPYEANVGSKRDQARTQVLGVTAFAWFNMPIISNRYCMAWLASSSGSLTFNLRARSVEVAKP